MKSQLTQKVMQVVLVVAGVLIAGTSWGQHVVMLRAEAFDKALPNGVTAPMWGYALDTDGNFGTTAGEDPTAPGPVLTIPSGIQGDQLIVILKNNLSVPVSIVIPGQDGYSRSSPNEHTTFTDSAGRTRASSFVKETAPGGVGVYFWQNVKPGTFLYHSGSHAAVQVPMGLYGALKRDVSAGLAYAGVVYGTDATVVFSAIDTNLNAAVAGGTYGTGPGATMSSTIHSRPQYFLVNGEAFSLPAPPAIPAGTAGQTNLIRYVNACADSHAPALNGLRVTAVAEDGRPYTHVKSLAVPYLPALKTMDVLVSADVAGQFALYDRALGLVNGTEPDGGMLRYVEFTP